MTIISVDPESLRIAAAQAHGAAELVAGIGPGPAAELAVAAQPGWSTTAELVAAQQMWTAFLAARHDSVTSTAQALRAAADTYAAAEHEAADHWRRGRGLGA
jgi:hypothetical protein